MFTNTCPKMYLTPEIDMAFYLTGRDSGELSKSDVLFII